jgi:hypothetical protein
LDIKRRALIGQHNFVVRVRHFPAQKEFSLIAFPYLTLVEKAAAMEEEANKE